MKLKSVDQHIKELMKNPKFKKAYEEEKMKMNSAQASAVNGARLAGTISGLLVTWNAIDGFGTEYIRERLQRALDKYLKEERDDK